MKIDCVIEPEWSIRNMIIGGTILDATGLKKFYHFFKARIYSSISRNAAILRDSGLCRIGKTIYTRFSRFATPNFFYPFLIIIYFDCQKSWALGTLSTGLFCWNLKAHFRKVYLHSIDSFYGLAILASYQNWRSGDKHNEINDICFYII